MIYRKLKDGTHTIGIVVDKRFFVYASAYDAREAKALLKAWRAVLDLFHTTSAGWVTMDMHGKEIPRGSTKKRKAKENSK